MRCSFPTNDLDQLRIYSYLFTEDEFTSSLTLSHYTKEENLGCIIHDQTVDLRLTRVDTFDDKNEAEHVIEMFKLLCNECLSENLIDNEYYKMMISSIDSYTNVVGRFKNMYVFCFSKNNRCDYLIKHYACRNNSRGVTLELNTVYIEDILFCKELSTDNNYPQIFIYDVIYDTYELRTYLKQLVKKAYSLRDQDDINYTISKQIFFNMLCTYALVHKSTDYSAEEETRLVINIEKINLKNGQIIIDEHTDKYIHVYLPIKCIYHIHHIIPNDD